jgi:hypothetical protein
VASTSGAETVFLGAGENITINCGSGGELLTVQWFGQ